MNQKIIFFGSGYYTIPIVEKLKKHNLVLVITTEKQGKFTDFLKFSKIPFLQSDLKNKEDREKIKMLQPTLGILASYGAFVPQSVIDIFQLGIFNIHPSLLPKYKGPSPVQYTIKNADRKSGVSIIKLDDQIDHGPIIAQAEIPLSGIENLQTLTETLFEKGSDMIDQILAKIENGEKIEEQEQNHSEEVFTYKISKEDGKIDFQNPPKNLNNLIRAFYPWPGVWGKWKFDNKEKIIKLFPEQKIQVEGKNIMTYKDFLNGYGASGKILIERITSL